MRRPALRRRRTAPPRAPVPSPGPADRPRPTDNPRQVAAIGAEAARRRRIRRPRLVELAVCLVALLLLAVPVLAHGLSSNPSPAEPQSLTSSTGSASPSPVPSAAVDAGGGKAEVSVAAFTGTVTPDVLVTSRTPLPVSTRHQLAALAGPSIELRQGSVHVGSTSLPVTAADPSTFRDWAPAGTADLDGVWQVMAAGELVVQHATSTKQHLQLGSTVSLIGTGSGAGPGSVVVGTRLRLGALATTTVPGSQLLVANSVGTELGLPSTNAVLLSAAGQDPGVLARRARAVVAAGAHTASGSGPATGLTVRQLTQGTVDVAPQAVLTGGDAAKEFGSFTYQYGQGSQIIIDPAWVAANIRTDSVPILGNVTCHRLMFPQLRAALAQVVSEGLSSAIHPDDFGGCYNPRFQDHNRSEPISLHAWGIAIDINVHQNERGTVGLMNRRVVAIFKHWGFAWGGDWSYTDPMHFQLAELIRA